ncbi:malto-oligosyltrehalose trehalohydrolase [Novipirellula artificiosorum]|uniref:Malto-oligosyltrehalose trehalohydrolase n=1 Tax=Novipirellula artificiosorum TaxID=2528016 RepID=A0A5C6DFC6_9BACT|nr:malto-oligosyltrehalose trehalohydrolase [Novipirellula artificiosorum]TWU34441.1 Malto-oligosyltrehalose trehalohydrolase [Novipirellula artificiosorum]
MNPRSIPQIELHRYLGAQCVNEKQTRFLVWGNEAERIEVELPDQGLRFPLAKDRYGYHHGVIDDCDAGQRYWLRIDGGPRRPDPVSHYQPLGVHGPSEVVNTTFDWTDAEWKPPSTDDLILYELHVGAFTDEGTFAAAIDRLDELVELGVTGIELMPLAESAGRWNWGYDGVGLFAPSHNFGSPHDLKRLVDVAHQKGLAVIVDVVYNHVGPEGNYLGDFGPYFSSAHSTPWGEAPNFDDPDFGEDVRRFIIANAIYWLDTFHFDGLRVDAIHCTRDDSDPHVVAEMAAAVSEYSRANARNVYLIAESNVYDPEMLIPLNKGGIGFDAAWCDDFLHSVFATLRPGEQLSNRAYYPETDLAQTLSKGYVYEGTLRTTRHRSEPLNRVKTDGLVYSIQNHDFIGNHPLAKRLHQLTSRETQRAAATLLMLTPAIPMLFMGEEFCSNRPFLFFVDFGDQRLRDAVVKGRHNEYPQHDWSQGMLPTEPAAFEASKLEPRNEGDLEVWKYYQSLIALRKAWRGSGLLSDENLESEYDPETGIFVLRYHNDDETATVLSRLSPAKRDAPAAIIAPSGERILDSLPGATPDDQLLINHAKVFIERRAL